DQPVLRLFLRQRARPDLFLEPDADAFRGARLPAYVDGGGLVLADADGQQAADGMLGRRRGDTLGDARKNPIAHRAAIEQPIVFHSWKSISEGRGKYRTPSDRLTSSRRRANGLAARKCRA